MNPGKLDKRITILKGPDTNNGFVKPLGDTRYVPYKTIWAKIEYISSKEIFSGNANNTLNKVKFIIRYCKDVTADMKINYDGVTYDIKGMRPLDTKKMYLIIVGEVIKHE